jgi:Flp pilus assembly pilin Flp
VRISIASPTAPAADQALRESASSRYDVSTEHFSLHIHKLWGDVADSTLGGGRFGMTSSKKRRKRLRNRFGQGITEYGAMIAFVAILVALVFSVSNSRLKGAISAAFSSVSGQLNNLSTASTNSSS